jgi:hypothetical protein
MGYRKEAAKGLSEGTLWLIGIIVLGMIVGGVVFAINVATSNARGAGEAEIKNNSAENRIEKQERFEKLYAKVKTNEDLVAQHTASLAATPDSIQIKTVLEGVKSACNASVNEYNAEARKVTSMDWRAYDLPESLTNTRCQ